MISMRGWSRLVALHLCAISLTVSATAYGQATAWKIGTVVAPPSVLGVIVDEGAASIGKATGGRIKAERFQNPNEQELTQNIVRGRLEMGYISATGVAVAVQEAGVLNMPYIWRNEEERDYVTDKFVVPLMEKILDSKGLTLVKYGDAGWTNLFCKTPCTSPDKMKGMKVRSSPTAGSKMFAERLGANGVGMSLADFYPALEQGVVAAGELTFSFYLIGPASQSAPHYVFTRHNHQPAMFIAHKRTWQALSQEDRQAIVAALPAAADTRRRVSADEEPRKAAHRAKGGYVHELTDGQRAEWAKIIEPGLPALAESYGGRSKELYEAIQKGKQEFASVSARK